MDKLFKRSIIFTASPSHMDSLEQNTYTQCQSCGMPLKRDKKGGGTEKDGSLNNMYCSSCYQDGAFTNPQMSVQEMQTLVDTILKDEMKWWKIFRRLAVNQIPKLVRWKK